MEGENTNMKIKSPVAVIAISLLVLSFSACLNFPSTRSADSANRGAEACCHRLNAGLDHLQEQLPAITKSAEQAAAAYVGNGFAIAAFGEPGLVSEAVGRAGGMMAITVGNLKSTAKTKTVVLLFPHPETQENDLSAATEIKKQGGMIVLFGKPSMSDAAKKAGIALNCFIDTGFSHSLAGTVPKEEDTVFPADSIMNMAALWCWTGEFVAACTRLGKMPPMYQSYSVPGAKERAKKFSGLKFHTETPTPIAAGTLGLQYLSELKRCLATLNEKELGHIRAVAEQVATTVRSGHTVYVSVMGHALGGHLPRLKKETGYLQPLNANSLLGKDDFVFAIGYDDIFPKLVEETQKAEAGLAWSLTDYKTPGNGGPDAIPSGQIFINQRWALGDAVVTVPGYEIKILPPSGVIAETILWMVLAEISAREVSTSLPK